MFKTTVNNLSNHFKDDLGIQDDDLVFMFSGVWGLGALDEGIETIEKAVDKTLSKGTLIIPTFSYSWSSGENYNLKTPCPEMGSFSNYVLENDIYKRTDNPNFSVSIRENKYNKTLVDDLLNIGDDCFDENSIFGKVVEYAKSNRAWILLLGGAFDDVKYRSTFIHYAQQKQGVLHRYVKEFHSPDNSRTVTQLVRFLDEKEYIDVKGEKPIYFNFPVEEDYSQYGEDVDAAGLLRQKEFGYYPSRMVPVHDVVQLYQKKLVQNPLYCIDKASLR